MLTPNVLAKYLGAQIVFVEEHELRDAENNILCTYEKNSNKYVDPTLLHMIAARAILPHKIRLVLRNLYQLEDIEVIELSEHAAKRSDFDVNHIRKIKRTKNGKNITIQVSLSDDGPMSYHFVINQDYNMSIAEIMYPPMGHEPVTTYCALVNQPRCMDWLMTKQLDVFDLQSLKMARRRPRWGLKDYL